MTAAGLHYTGEGQPRAVKVLVGLVYALAVPLFLANLLGWGVSGIWLLVLGQWTLLIGGILAAVISLGLSLILAPSLLLSGLAAHFMERKKLFVTLLFVAFANLYTTVIVTAWCFLAFLFCALNASAESRVPALVWSYGIATGPWASMAQRDKDSLGSSIGAFVVELAYLAAVLILILSPAAYLHAAAAFLGFMTLGMVVQIVLGSLLFRETFADSAGGPDGKGPFEPYDVQSQVPLGH